MRWGMRAESVIRALECSHLRIEIWESSRACSHRAVRFEQYKRFR